MLNPQSTHTQNNLHFNTELVTFPAKSLPPKYFLHAFITVSCGDGGRERENKKKKERKREGERERDRKGGSKRDKEERRRQADKHRETEQCLVTPNTTQSTKCTQSSLKKQQQRKIKVRSGAHVCVFSCRR